jgi:hypothetical protein
MTVLRSTFATGVFAAALAAGTLAATAASAAVACNQWGECWHTPDRYEAPAGVGIAFHSDNWGRHHHHGHHWRRDRDERGYYRNGVWIRF